MEAQVLAKMGDNIQKQLNEYLKNVETVVGDALERFDALNSSYGETNSDFINDIREITVNSVHLACKRFEIESKLKKMKNFPMTLSTYANTLKNNANEFDAGRGVEHEKNDVHQTLSASSSLNDLNALDPADELKGQKTLLNSLHISGIPIDAIKTEDAQIAVLQKLCKKANVSYNKDVDQFYVKNNALIVKFHRLESKDKIRNYAENKDLWTNELLELNKGQDPSKIKVCHYMTPFYSKMWFAAEKFQHQGRLHSFKLTEKGLVVKRKQNTEETTFLSEAALSRFIKTEK